MNNHMKIFHIFFVCVIFANTGCLDKYNVLLIVVDDLRPVLGVYGNKYAYTPNIDKFAQNSFVFKNAFCQQAQSAPSRNSFLTSRRPDSILTYDSFTYWRHSLGDFTSLPQHFRNNNYYTYSIGKVFDYGASSNFTDDSEYSWSDVPYHPPSKIVEDAKSCPAFNGLLAHNLVCPIIVKEQPNSILPDLEILNESLRFIRNAIQITKGLPFFLAIGFYKPHIPFKFPLEYLKYHPISKITLPTIHGRPPSLPSLAWNTWTDVREYDDIHMLNISFPYGEMPDDTMRKIIQSYFASVSYIDDIIGEVLSAIDRDTIVILLGDNGWSMGEHGEFSKYSNYDTATRVPLIIHVPNMCNRQVFVKEFVELVDIFPTLVDLTGVSPSLEICEPNLINKICTEGRSLAPLLRSKLKPFKYKGKSAVFTQCPRVKWHCKNPNSDKPRLKDIEIMGYSIRTKTHRYTEWVEFNQKKLTPNWNRVYARELYDHRFDANENLNLADRDGMEEFITELRGRLILGWRHA